MIKALTKQYIEAFDNKDIKKIESMFTEDFALEDPVVKRIDGKIKVLSAIQGIFGSCKVLNFKATNIYHDNQTTIIEFTLELDETRLSGVDIIEWEGDKMKELRAYLDIPCGDK